MRSFVHTYIYIYAHNIQRITWIVCLISEIARLLFDFCYNGWMFALFALFCRHLVEVLLFILYSFLSLFSKSVTTFSIVEKFIRMRQEIKTAWNEIIMTYHSILWACIPCTRNSSSMQCQNVISQKSHNHYMPIILSVYIKT